MTEVDPAPTVAAWLVQATRRLAAVSTEAPLEARAILQSVTRTPLAWLLANADRLLTPAELASLEQSVEARLEGDPLNRLTGTVSFRDLELSVPPGVFAPRPETEGLVERVLEHLRGVGVRPDGAPFRVLELGTGSGAILLSLLHERSDVVVRGVELSEEAAQATERNAARVRNADAPGQLRLLRGDLFRPLAGEEPPGSFDVIVSNPPYIPDGLWGTLPREVRFHESPLALLGGADGTDVITRIAAAAPTWLCPGGLLALEIDESHGARVERILAAGGPWSRIAIQADLAGRHRYALATLRR